MKITFELSVEELANLFGSEPETELSSSTKGYSAGSYLVAGISEGIKTHNHLECEEESEGWPCDVCDRPCEEDGECPYMEEEYDDYDECCCPCNCCCDRSCENTEEDCESEERDLFFRFMAYENTMTNWSENPAINLHKMRWYEEYFNNKLERCRYAKLIDILDIIGFDLKKFVNRTEMTLAEYNELCSLGWTEGPIDFGLNKIENSFFRDGIVNFAFLDFNVEGYLDC